jgi:hypothetical protein
MRPTVCRIRLSHRLFPMIVGLREGLGISIQNDTCAGRAAYSQINSRNDARSAEAVTIRFR